MNGWRSPLFMGWARSFFAVEPEPPPSRGARQDGARCAGHAAPL